MTGKIGKAPCGHKGEHLTVNFVRCTEGCKDDAFPPEEADDWDTFRCPKCDSKDTEDYSAPFLSVADFWKHCWTCGHAWPVFSP